MWSFRCGDWANAQQSGLSKACSRDLGILPGRGSRVQDWPSGQGQPPSHAGLSSASACSLSGTRCRGLVLFKRTQEAPTMRTRKFKQNA